MTAYRYLALDDAGQEHRGVLEAESGRSARGMVRERGLFPLQVDSVAARGTAGGGRLRGGRLALLTRQWSTLLGAGLTMGQALAALIEQAEDETARQLLAGLRSDVLAGYSLHAALERYPQTFPAIYRASVAAGEQSGELARILDQLADHLEQRDRLRQKTLQALLYPAIVAGVASLVVGGLMTWVVPQVVGVFQHSRQALPPLTALLLALSAFLRDWGWLLLAALAGAGLGARAALRRDTLRRHWDRRLLALPLLGRHLRAVDSARFASTLAILIGSGVPLLAALDAGRAVVARLPLRDALDQVAEEVRAGRPLARALAASRAFPPLLVHMVASGEATGRLDQLLARAAALQQQELENRGAVLAGLLEPAFLLLMGGTVLLIVLAVMQPIIEINTLVR
jgi:general secretion pathway protein F